MKEQAPENKKFAIRCRAIILHDGKLLVVKHEKDAGFAALPGGHLEWGEDVKGCIQREIIEELGVVPDIGRLLYVHTFIHKGNVQELEFFFEVLNGGDYVDITGRMRSHAHEIAEILWVSPDDDIEILPEKFAEAFKTGTLFARDVQYIGEL